MHSALIWLTEKLAEKLLFSYTGEELTNTHIQGVQEKVKKVIILFDTKIRLNSYFSHIN